MNVNVGVSTPTASDLLSLVGSPQHTSSTYIGSIRRECKSEKSRLSILNVNCQSITAKNQALSQLTADSKPNIIIANETWLTENHGIAEILISDGYVIERRDRERHSHGGVIIAVKKDLIATRESELETD